MQSSPANNSANAARLKVHNCRVDGLNKGERTDFGYAPVEKVLTNGFIVRKHRFYRAQSNKLDTLVPMKGSFCYLSEVTFSYHSRKYYKDSKRIHVRGRDIYSSTFDGLPNMQAEYGLK